ncbi:hypothetical protein T484DRAFT_1909894, partial [Baffinella frigidus]
GLCAESRGWGRCSDSSRDGCCVTCLLETPAHTLSHTLSHTHTRHTHWYTTTHTDRPIQTTPPPPAISLKPLTPQALNLSPPNPTFPLSTGVPPS